MIGCHPRISERRFSVSYEPAELQRLIDLASRLYHVELSNGSLAAASARIYLGERRVFAKAIDQFRLGFCPRSNGGRPWLLQKLESSGYKPGMLEAAGLMVRGRDDQLVDPMAGRVVFPQVNPAGQVIGFVGRAISEQVSESYKYVASPATVVFRKSEILYRIDMSYRSIMSENRAIVVEGPLDAILMWQIGQPNTVAVGTARMTDAQAQTLARYTKRIEVMFDRDDAGDEAFSKLRKERGVHFEKVERRDVPAPYKDPAEWIRSVIDRKLAG